MPSHPVRPWYFDATIKFGLPAVASAFLLYFLTNVVNAKLDALVLSLNMHQAEMTNGTSSIITLLTEQNRQQGQMLSQQWTQIGVLQRTCLNTSKTDADRIACAAMTSPRIP